MAEEIAPEQMENKPLQMVAPVTECHKLGIPSLRVRCKRGLGYVSLFLYMGAIVMGRIVGPMAVMVAIALSVAGCATTYGEMGATGGVAAAAITSDTYRISARGNGFTDATVIQDYVLLKAAETTMAAGHTHFTVLDGRDATDRSIGQTAGTFNNWGGFVTYNPGTTYNIVKPGEDMMIRAWTPASNASIPPNTFAAGEVFSTINPRVKRSS